MDTAVKRQSAIGVSLPWRGPPLPSGSVDQGDRQQLGYVYRGILAEEADILIVSGLEYTLPEGRLHYSFQVSRYHFVMPDGKMHYTLPEGG